MHANAGCSSNLPLLQSSLKLLALPSRRLKLNVDDSWDAEKKWWWGGGFGLIVCNESIGFLANAS